VTSTHRLVDLSHPIENGMETYRGLPVPVIEDHLSREASRAIYAEGTEFHIARISMVANTGTYLDAPSHRWADGADVSDLDLVGLVDLDGRVPRASRSAPCRPRCGDGHIPGARFRGGPGLRRRRDGVARQPGRGQVSCVAR
jgi:Putative cyclase